MENKVKKKKWPFWVCTFIIAVCGSYLVQTYLTIIEGAENVYDAKLLSSETTQKSNSVVTKSYSDMLEQAMKSVVGISSIKVSEESLFDPLTVEKWGLGTGIVVSKDGHILTNKHLVRDIGSSVTVTLEDGESVEGRVLWYDENIDLSIVKISKTDLEVANFGNSDNLRVGDKAFAIGNPLGIEFQRTTTSGIISGLNRSLMLEENGSKFFMQDLIQTDASINVGNSGGPLVNESGEVVGVNTVKITSAEGIGFAVPINLVLPIIEAFEEDNFFEEPYLGMFVYDKEIVKYARAGINIETGLYITNVVQNGPADKAGIKEGDIILNIDGVLLNKVTDLKSYIYSKSPGDTIMLTVNRNNQIKSISLELE